MNATMMGQVLFTVCIFLAGMIGGASLLFHRHVRVWVMKFDALPQLMKTYRMPDWNERDLVADKWRGFVKAQEDRRRA